MSGAGGEDGALRANDSAALAEVMRTEFGKFEAWLHADGTTVELSAANWQRVNEELDARDAVVGAARRHARVLREWDADSNVLPLASECGDGTSCDVRCGDGSRPGANEYDHAEAHFLAALDSLTRASSPATECDHEWIMERGRPKTEHCIKCGATPTPREAL